MSVTGDQCSECGSGTAPAPAPEEPPTVVAPRPDELTLTVGILGVAAVVGYMLWCMEIFSLPGLLIIIHPLLFFWLAGRYWVKLFVTRCLLLAGVFISVFLYGVEIEDVWFTQCASGILAVWAASYLYLFAVLVLEKCMQEVAAWWRRRAAPAP